PFRWNGFDTVVIQPLADGTIPLELLAAAMEKERPQLVAISHVQWATGFRTDLDALGALCRSHGAWSLVDATQSWCNAPLNLRGTPIDILAASGYKWPLAGMGNGFLHLAEHVREELAERNGCDAMAARAEGHLDPVASGPAVANGRWRAWAVASFTWRATCARSWRRATASMPWPRSPRGIWTLWRWCA